MFPRLTGIIMRSIIVFQLIHFNEISENAISKNTVFRSRRRKYPLTSKKRSGFSVQFFSPRGLFPLFCYLISIFLAKITILLNSHFPSAQVLSFQWLPNTILDSILIFYMSQCKNILPQFHSWKWTHTLFCPFRTIFSSNSGEVRGRNRGEVAKSVKVVLVIPIVEMLVYLNAR